MMPTIHHQKFLATQPMKVIDKANQAGVGLTSASPYYIKDSPKGQFIIGYAELHDSQIREGVYHLSQTLMNEMALLHDVA